MRKRNQENLTDGRSNDTAVIQSASDFTGLSKETLQRLGDFNYIKGEKIFSHEFFRLYKVMPYDARKHLRFVDNMLSCNSFYTNVVANAVDCQECIKTLASLYEKLEELNDEIGNTSRNSDFHEAWGKLKRGKLTNAESEKLDAIFECYVETEDDIKKFEKERDLCLYYAQKHFAENVEDTALE